MLENLRYEDFAPLLGQSLKVEAGGTQAEVEVAEAELLHSPSPRATPSFRVVLRSEAGWRAAQGIFRLSHPTLGAIDLFVVPIGPNGGAGLCYEIIVN